MSRCPDCNMQYSCHHSCGKSAMDVWDMFEEENQALKARIETLEKVNQDLVKKEVSIFVMDYIASGMELHYENKIKELENKIQELESELKCVKFRDFCYDLQVWVKDFLLDNCYDLMMKEGLLTFQDVRKAVYTHRVRYYKTTPEWGHETYLNKEKGEE